jgi:hypothetical protein
VEGVSPGVGLGGDAPILATSECMALRGVSRTAHADYTLVHVDILLLGLDLSGPCGYFKPNGLTL